MAEPKRWMVFDVESGGLHGPVFAAGYVVLGADGREVAAGLRHCPLSDRGVSAESLAWLARNVPDLGAGALLPGPRELRDWFWGEWLREKAQGAVLAADVPWPVEARFLAACVDDDPGGREWEGPYPLVDVASVRLAAGLDPLGVADRRAGEVPAHNPLCDARQSARLLREALAVLREDAP
jgi:hypothetical protein